VLYGLAFNAKHRGAGPPDEDLAATIRWIERSSPPLAQLADAPVIRTALDALALKGDGTPAAASTISRKRAVLFNVLEYAVELGHLATNPILTVRWRTPKNTEQVDAQVVVNHRQARALFDAVRQQGSTGQRLVAFFALLYYAALRPAEAADLRKSALSIPEQGWGELYLPGSAPTTGAAWGDSRTRRDRRGLKHRPRNEVRVVPSPPPLTELLHNHLTTFGTADDGRLFRGARGGDLSESTYGRTWQQAREQALSAAQPLGLPRTHIPYGTPQCRPGWAAVSLQPRLPSGPDTASRCSIACTPSASPANKNSLESVSRRRSTSVIKRQSSAPLYLPAAIQLARVSRTRS